MEPGSCAVDLSERRLAILALVVAALASTISYDRKYVHRYETNPASYSAWANDMEC